MNKDLLDEIDYYFKWDKSEFYKQAVEPDIAVYMPGPDVLLLEPCKAELLKSQWINVEDRLPEHGQHVLSVYRRGSILLSTYLRGGFKVLFHCDDHKPVTHWMPLPIPPTEIET